ncbi:type II toxin-antitoxin system Phd/YefM family antitoxin [Sulfurimonas sp.]
MQAVNYSYARNNLKSLISQACEYDEECIITSKNNQNVVLMPLSRFNEIKDDIKKSLQEIKDDDFFSVDKAFEKVLAHYEH